MVRARVWVPLDITLYRCQPATKQSTQYEWRARARARLPTTPEALRVPPLFYITHTPSLRNFQGDCDCVPPFLNWLVAWGSFSNLFIFIQFSGQTRKFIILFIHLHYKSAFNFVIVCIHIVLRWMYEYTMQFWIVPRTANFVALCYIGFQVHLPATTGTIYAEMSAARRKCIKPGTPWGIDSRTPWHTETSEWRALNGHTGSCDEKCRRSIGRIYAS